MKTLTLSFFFFAIVLHINAQNDTDVQAFINKKCGNTPLGIPKESTKCTARFNDIEVLDARPDTSRAGIILEGISQHQVLFQTSARTVFTNYLNHTYSNPAAHRSILFVIKKCWLSDSIGKPLKNSFFSQIYFGTFRFRAEIYCKRRTVFCR